MVSYGFLCHWKKEGLLQSMALIIFLSFICQSYGCIGEAMVSFVEQLSCKKNNRLSPEKSRLCLNVNTNKHYSSCIFASQNTFKRNLTLPLLVMSQTDNSLGVKQFECYADLYEKNVIHFMEEYWSVLHMNDFRASPEHVKFYNDVRPFDFMHLITTL